MSGLPGSVDAGEYTADYYQNRCGGFEFFERFQHRVLKPVFQAALQAARLRPGQKALDVGCGRGELAAHLTDQGVDVLGVDYAASAVQVARRSFPKTRFECRDLGDLSWAGGGFDCVFLLGTIEHLTDAQVRAFLPQARRILRDGGRLIVTTCTNRLYYKTWSYRFRDGLARLLAKAGLAVRRPMAPRSDEDERMHINEQHFFSLKALLGGAGWDLRVLPQANPKLCVDRLYGKDLPEGFPLRRRPSWVQRAYGLFVFRFPLSLFLARCNLCVLTKTSEARA